MTRVPRCPVLIAHRGASGYLPEHTLAAKAMAHAQLADFLEQDLVLTKDDVPVVLHDIYLDTVTDAAVKFPRRARPDGRYYVMDFTWNEICQLHVSERFDHSTQQPVFPNRFPAHSGQFSIPSLAMELEFIRGLNRSTGRLAGIYPEIKQPRFHREHGKQISPIILETLKEFGYATPESRCFLQCFDADELKRIRSEHHCRLNIIQLLDEADCNAMLTSPQTLDDSLKEIACYAQGIGPALTGVFRNTDPTELVTAAHSHRLLVHPWTYRADALVTGFSSFEELHAATLQLEIDGLFTDFPDRSRDLFKALMT